MLAGRLPSPTGSCSGPAAHLPGPLDLCVQRTSGGFSMSPLGCGLLLYLLGGLSFLGYYRQLRPATWQGPTRLELYLAICFYPILLAWYLSTRV
jgi:hypothetical protein